MALSTAKISPKQTLKNIDTLERKYGFNDALFRNVHHWGKKHDLSGSLEKHIEYLKGPFGTGRTRYNKNPPNNYIVAQRIEYIVKNETTKESLGKLIIEAKKKYPFRD